MSKTRVLLISGYKGSGKDLVAKMIQDQLISDVVIDHFAADMKQILATTLGMTLEQLDIFKNDHTMPHRGYLQRFGTDAIKPVFGNDVWADKVYSRLDPNVFNIIPDFRFPNEVSSEERFDIRTLKVDRGLTPTDSHSSENSLQDRIFDYTVSNKGTISDLSMTVANLVHTDEWFTEWFQ